MSFDWKVFASTFVLLFLAEMGDKTQLAVISMSSKTSRPLTVFAASILALGAVTAIGITVGCGIVAVVPAVWVKRVAAGLFFLAGVLVLFDVL